MDLCLDGFDVLGLDSLGPSRGWSMKRGHRKRLDAASCRNPKKMGKASEEVPRQERATLVIKSQDQRLHIVGLSTSKI